jgi:Iron-containing redox enzyme
VASGHFLRAPERNLEPLHRRLAEFNRLRLLPELDVADWQQQLRHETELRIVEGHFIEAERAQVQEVAQSAPTQPREFVTWFESLKEIASQESRRLLSWLAATANRGDLSWFLVQEQAGAGALDDLLALTQVKLPRRARLELARDYWDEMGHGHASAMRSQLLEDLRHDLHAETTEAPIWETLARDNLMLGLATNRRYAFQSIGALGALDLFEAERAASVSAGLIRLGFSNNASDYFAMRSKLCVLRSYGWLEGAILPLVAQDARCATAIAEGALLRLAADARCYRRYERELVPLRLAPHALAPSASRR